MRHRSLLALTLVLLVSSCSSQTIETTTTSGGVAPVDVGEPLGWERSGSIGETWPVSLLKHQGSLFLFGTPELRFSSLDGSGLDAWVSSDGRSWASLGTVIASPHLVRSVASTPQGLVALGNDGASGSPTVWVSSDGLQWAASTLPTDGPDLVGSLTWLIAAGGTEDLLVIFGRNQFDPIRLIFDALPEELQTESATDTYQMGYGGPPLEVTLQGPLGITVFSATAEDLGLSEDEVALLMGDPDSVPEPITVWSSVDGETWRMGHMDATFISSVAATPYGDLMAFGRKRSDSTIWFSNDGIVWDRQTTSGVADYQITSWNDGFVGIRNQGSELAYSPDGWEWDQLAMDVLPTNNTWNYVRIVAGGAGIAAVAYGPSTVLVPPGPFVLDKDGYTLTMARWGAPLFVSWGDHSEFLEISPQGPQVEDEVVVDFEAETVAFLNPETAKPLVTFTFDEITIAEQARFDRGGNQHRVLLFSTDGVQWSFEELDEIIGLDRQITHLLVTSDGVVAATTHPPASFVSWGSPPPSEVEMWFGQFP